MEHLWLRTFVLIAAAWLQRQQAAALEYLLEENRVLHEQLGDRKPRLTNRQRARLARKGHALGRAGLAKLATLARPDTILGWYRKLVAQKYDGSARRESGRPKTSDELCALIIAMAKENPKWGYTRIRGALDNLGHRVARSTIARVLKDAGIDPAPERPETWSTFLAAQWGAISGGDFFTLEAVTLTGIVRYHVFFVIDLATRKVEIGGIKHIPYEGWLKNVVRGLIDSVDGALRSTRYSSLDRDPLYTKDVRALLESGGVKVVTLPPRSPDLNAHAERFIRSIRSECLSRVIPLGEQHLRQIIYGYVAHYNSERNHQGIDNRLIEPGPEIHATGAIVRKRRLGGLLSYYPIGRPFSTSHE